MSARKNPSKRKPPGKKKGGLTPKQQLFVQEYLKDLNATAAARRAGYAETTANRKAPNWVCKSRVNSPYPEIWDAVQAAMDERSKRTEIEVDDVLREIAKLAFSDIRDLFTDEGYLRNIKDLPDSIAAAVSAVEVVTRPGAEVDADGNREVENVHKIRLWDKRGSLEMLGKHLRMFVERHEHTGKDGEPLEMSTTELARRIAFLLRAGK